MKRFLLLLLGTVTTILVLAVAGGGERNSFQARAAAAQEATPNDAIAVEPIGTTEPTSIAEPTATAQPDSTGTSTPEPTATAEVTSTGLPIATPEPTETAQPTATATADAGGANLETLTIFKIDENGDPLTDDSQGACFGLFDVGEEEGGEYEDLLSQACDASDGSNDGTIVLEDLYPGYFSYRLRELRAPTGYDDRFVGDVRIEAGGPNEVTIPNGQIEILTVYLVDEQGAPIVIPFTDDACFRLVGADPGIAWGYCTSDLFVLGVPPGTYLLEETRAPAGYFPAEPREVSVVAGRDNEVTVVNRTGEVLSVFVVDERGAPLASAGCFALLYPNPPFHSYSYNCDEYDGTRDGTVVLPAILGTYRLLQFRAPRGYDEAEPREVTIVAGGPNQVTVANLPRGWTSTPTPTPPFAPTQAPATDAPTATGVGGVLSLPSTGVGSGAEAAVSAETLLVAAVALGLLGAAARRRRQTTRTRENLPPDGKGT